MALVKEVGRVAEIGTVQEGTGKTGYQWQRQQIVIEIGGLSGVFHYLAAEATSQTALEQISGLHIGDRVEVRYTVTARKWNDKWFNSVNLVSVDLQTAGAPTPEAPGQPAPAEDLNPEEHQEDLPF